MTGVILWAGGLGTKTVTHDRHLLAVLILAFGLDLNTPYGGLELDERVSLVMSVGRARLTAGAEVGIVAHGTFEALTNNVGLAGAVAERAVAADTVVARAIGGTSLSIRKLLVNRNKTVAGVHEARAQDAVCAVVPVRAVHTLVADTTDELVAAIADGVVPLVAAGGKATLYI